MTVKIEDPLCIHPPEVKEPLPAHTRQLLKEKLRTIFGYPSFRGPQEKIIQNVLHGKDAIVIMPTGAGKSLCYQLPPLLGTRGGTLIISPLIALMKNQVDQLTARGINAYFLNSTLSKRRTHEIKEKAIQGEACLLYISPECFCKEDNIVFFKRIPLGLVAIDESHCISEWGHDFRPKYRLIRPVLNQMRQVPVMALTASATPKVQEDICKNLNLEKAPVFITSFNRKNLYYQVVAKCKDKDKEKKESISQLITYVHKYRKQMGIVYCLTRKTVEEVTARLRMNDIKALPYHAGLDAKIREKNQDAFLNEDIQVIVATIAFGMGIDKPNIRFVIHYDAPKSLEGYYQETGRAGRDGKKALCLLLFNPKDKLKIYKMYRDKPATERDNAYKLFDEIIAYAHSPVCRRKNILQHFGETYPVTTCGHCDNCQSPTRSYAATMLLRLVLKAVGEAQNRKDISDLAKHLSGIHHESNNEGHLPFPRALYGRPSALLRRPERDSQKPPAQAMLSTFGKGKDKDVVFWRSVIRQALSHGFIMRCHRMCAYNDMLSLSEKGKAYLRSPHPIRMFEEHTFDVTGMVHERMPKLQTSTRKKYDKKLLQMLKDLQKNVAEEKGLPSYIIFHPTSLREMAMIYPRTMEELAHVHGVGSGKVKRYGKPFLQLITRYVEKHKIIPSPEIIVKSSGKRSQCKINIIRQIDRQVPPKEIMQLLGLSLHELVKEIENICRSGTKLKLDYYLDKAIEKEKQEEIYHYFLQCKADDIDQALETFKDCSEEDIRLMWVHVMCELGN